MNIKAEIIAKYDTMAYNIKRHIFSWNIDSDNDITLSVLGLVHFVKYKEQTIIYFGKKEDLLPAPKYYNKSIDR